MKGFRIIVLSFAGLSSVITFLLFLIALQRLTWEYNEEGNHLDEETATNYTDSGIITWSLLTILFLAVSSLLFFLAWRLKKKLL